MKPSRLIKLSGLVAAVIALGMVGMTTSCKHDLTYNTPDDTTSNPIDTTPWVEPVDTCPLGVISFTEDVLPVLNSNCAIPGCHDPGTHEEGVIMNSYTNVIGTGDININNPFNSDFWEVLNETDPDKKMPPPPNPPLSAAQMQVIQQWLAQGAQNTDCTHNAGCDSSNVTYSGAITTIINNRCLGCHQGATPSGGVSLSGYSNVLAQVNSGKFLKSVKHQAGAVAMPYNSAKLDDCSIAKIESWINDGAPNN